MRLESLSNDCILNHHIGSVSTNGKGLVVTPGNTKIVKDYIITRSNNNSILARSTTIAYINIDIISNKVISIKLELAVIINNNILFTII